jgi:hypothetical protein
LRSGDRGRRCDEEGEVKFPIVQMKKAISFRF